MSDRDLLEAAARAAGLLVQGVEHFLGVFTGLNIRADDCPGGYRWNPLTDDGDALRLAVKLNLFDAISRAYCYVSDTVDIYAATRLAIVDAAAALTQPEGGA